MNSKGQVSGQQSNIGSRINHEQNCIKNPGTPKKMGHGKIERIDSTAGVTLFLIIG